MCAQPSLAAAQFYPYMRAKYSAGIWVLGLRPTMSRATRFWRVWASWWSRSLCPPCLSISGVTKAIKITQRGTCIIYGRSDSTIKRHGVRIGTAEIYRAVESLPEVLDSLVVDLEGLGGESKMLLFVTLKPGVELSQELQTKIKEKIRVDTSPRFVPDEVYQIGEVPRTLNGKKLEIPVKRILMGVPLDKAVNIGSVANPEALKFFLELRSKLSGSR